MNLLPTTEKNELRKGLKLRLIVVFLILISISFFIGFVMLWPSFFMTLDYFGSNNSENYSVGNESDSAMEQTLNLPAEINEKLSILQSDLNAVSVVESFNKIISFLPKEVSLNSVAFSRNQIVGEKKGVVITVAGTALNRDSLVAFSNLLKNSNFFSAVDMPVSSLAKDKNLPFTMKIFIET